MTELFTCSEREQTGPRSFRHAFSLKPIAFSRNGVLRRISNKWSQTGNADFPIGVDGLFVFRIDPRIAGKSPLVHFGAGAQWAHFALAGANNVAGAATENRVRFPNAWNGADLEYVLGGHRLYEYIWLRAGHPSAFTFIVAGHTGFDPIRLDFGAFRILDPVLELPEGIENLPTPLRWIVAQVGGKWQLTVTLPDGDWTGWRISA